MMSAIDESMLRRALRVAMNGRGYVEPNPMVGCVLVKNDQIIAEGWHTHFGGPHAEPTALADCRQRGNDPRGATAYVTLEPCCHTNKKTPPCAPRLIEAGIARVVIGCLDPNPDVDGKGVEMLRAAGVVVDAAPATLAAVFEQHIAPFRANAPYVTLKWAQSADGFVAGPGGRPVRISGPQSGDAVHRLRTRCHAIVVGSGTVLSDDPSLTVRGVEVINQPVRVVIDRRLRIPLTCKLLTEAGPPVEVWCDLAAAAPPDNEKWLTLESMTSASSHFALYTTSLRGYGNDNLFPILAALNGAAKHALVEPGPTLADSLLPVADRLWVFSSTDRLNAGPTAPRAAEIPRSYVETGRLAFGSDTLIEYLNCDAASFVTAAPSADFVLESQAAQPSA